jgi:signal transduction histidine kinase
MNTPAIHHHLEQLAAALESLSQLTLPPTEGLALRQARHSLLSLQAQIEVPVRDLHTDQLYRLSRSLSTSLDLAEVLEQVIDAVIELTGAERGYLLLLDPDTQQVAVQAARSQEGLSLSTPQTGYSRTVVQAVIEQDRSLLTTDAQADPRFSDQESVILQALRSILCVPLRWRGQTSGVIYVDNRIQSGVFGEQDLEVLEAFATQAAAAIENARLYTQTDRRLADRVAELEILGQISRQLNATLDLPQVAEITLDWARQGTRAEGGWIALGGSADQAETELLCLAGDRAGESISVTDPAIEPAWKQGQIVTFPPVEGRQASLAAPILRAGKPVGVLVVSGKGAFSSTSQAFLARLAGHAASARENARLHQAVQEANQAKSSFVSVVVHELRIPMTAIKGYADLLRQGTVGEINAAQANFLDVIRNNVSRMSTLISDLSDLNRVESGRMKLEPARFSLYNTVQEGVKSLGPRIAEKNQSLQVAVPDELPHVYADPQRASQIFTNLLNNAWKYTPEGGSIQVRAFQTDHPDQSSSDQTYIRVEIQDSGIGISTSDQEQLFTPFFRSDAQPVREQQGWGLGLSVASRLVELMGGEIGVVSQLEQGSTFWFTLPVASAVQVQEG